MSGVRDGKAARILDMIEERGGMTFRQIQEAAWEMGHPGVPFTYKNRGHWCTVLLGGPFYGPGLLRVFCRKEADPWSRAWRTSRWVRRKDVPHEGRPFSVMDRRTRRSSSRRR